MEIIRTLVRKALLGRVHLCPELYLQSAHHSHPPAGLRGEHPGVPKHQPFVAPNPPLSLIFLCSSWVNGD